MGSISVGSISEAGKGEITKHLKHSNVPAVVVVLCTSKSVKVMVTTAFVVQVIESCTTSMGGQDAFTRRCPEHLAQKLEYLGCMAT